MAYFHTIHFSGLDRIAVVTHPYVIDPVVKAHLHKKTPSQKFVTDQDWLGEKLGLMGRKNSTLFRQYADV